MFAPLVLGYAMLGDGGLKSKVLDFGKKTWQVSETMLVPEI